MEDDNLKGPGYEQQRQGFNQRVLKRKRDLEANEADMRKVSKKSPITNT